MKSLNTYDRLLAFKKGNRESFKWIYDRCHRVIYFYCLKFIRQEALAEEATADVFIKLWQKRHIIEPEEPIEAFLYKIAKDTAFNYLKKIASNSTLKKQYLENYPTENLKSGESFLLEKERLAAIEKVINSLPHKRREVFKMRYYEGKDNQSIAEQLHISVHTVKVHLAKARQFLKQQLHLQGE